MLLALDLLGVFVFGVSGGLVAVRRRLDVVGVVVLATATGLGGGLIRDVLIGEVPPAGLADWRYLATTVAAGLVTFRWHPAVGRLERVVTVFDAAGLGLFCVTGALVAAEAGAAVEGLDGPVPESGSVLAATPALLGPLRDLLRSATDLAGAST